MSRDRPPSPAPERRAPACPECGGELRFSHVEYASRGLERSVRRCAACGSVVRGEPQPKRQRSGERPPRRAKAPVDEGPPSNPVLDSDTARRLLGGE